MVAMRACLIAAVLLSPAAAQAAVFVVNEFPAGWATAQATPGRQLVSGEPFITFAVATDVFVINPAVFGITEILFANDLAANLPSSANVIVVQDAGFSSAAAAANAIALQVTVSTPGFFVYFNDGLDVPRLVYSADLSDNTADLLVVARMTNLSGQLAAMPTFTAANFSLDAADLSITKTTDATSTAQGTIVDYTIIVANAGPVTATDVVVNDTLPGSLELVSVTPSQGTCNAASPIVCNLGAILVGANATIALSTRVVATAGTITNTATATTPEGAPASATTQALTVVEIPTLSEWMLMAMAALLGIAAMLKLRTA